MRVTGASLAALASGVAMLDSDASCSSAATGGVPSFDGVAAAGIAGGSGSTGAMPSNVCLNGLSARAPDELVAVGVAAAGAGGAEGAAGGELTETAGGSERGGMTGAMPSKVCLRIGLTSGVAVASGLPTTGVAVACEGAGTDARVGGADETGRGGAVLGDEAGRGGAEERAGGNGVAELAAEAGRGARGAGVAVALSCGTPAGAGISSAPHSESMSSVGGAIDGRGGRPLTRSLSDLLSLIALQSPFHGPADKSSVFETMRDVRPL